jgi:hypothetical protein
MLPLNFPAQISMEMNPKGTCQQNISLEITRESDILVLPDKKTGDNQEKLTLCAREPIKQLLPCWLAKHFTYCYFCNRKTIGSRKVSRRLQPLDSPFIISPSFMIERWVHLIKPFLCKSYYGLLRVLY